MAQEPTLATAQADQAADLATLSAILVPFPRDGQTLDRPEIFGRVDERLREQRRVALYGDGGIGKSHIALEYAYRFRVTHPTSLVLWAPSGSQARLTSAFKIIARKLSLPGRTNSPQLVIRWLDENIRTKWLLVIDGADEREAFAGTSFKETMKEEEEKEEGEGKGSPVERDLLQGYLPNSSNGEVIVTTRNEALGEEFVGRENLVIVPALTEQEASQMLKSRVSANLWSEDDLGDLLEVLGHLPLSIMQAGAYINDNEMTIADYREDLSTNDLDMKEINGEETGLEVDSSSFQKVMRIWKLSFGQILREDPRAAEILRLSAILDGQGIPKLLLLREEERSRSFNAAIGTLQAFGLITTEIGGQNFWVHRLAQLCTRKWMDCQGQKVQWEQLSLKLLSKKYPYGDFFNWESCEELYPHARSVLDLHFTSDGCLIQRVKLLENLSSYEVGQGHQKIALKMGSEAFEIRKRIQGDACYDTTTSLSELARTLFYQGNYLEAEEASRRVLAFMTDKLGKDHPSTLQAVNDLACALDRQGKYSEAAESYETLVAGNEAARGADHPTTFTYIDNWATALHHQGKLAEAEEKRRQAFERREKVLGLEHPDTLSSLCSLASVLSSRGMYEDAEKAARLALMLREKVLGLEHEDTIGSRNTLSMLLMDSSRYLEAEELQQQNVLLSQKALGSGHPSTILYLANLGSILGNQGKYNEAESFLRQAFEKSRDSLGAENPRTLGYQNNLALFMLRQGRYPEAEEITRQVLEARTKLLGDKHPDTLTSRNNLAGALQRQKKYREAEEIFRQTLKDRESWQGPDHPLALRSTNNLAEVLREQGQLEEAETLHRAALERRRKGLGPKHADTLTSAHNLAHVLHQRSRHDEAKPRYEEALAGLKEVLGDGHPTTRACEADFAEMLREMQPKM